MNVSNWANYTKIYTFRDCFEPEQVEGEIKQINELMENDCMLVTDAISISPLVDHLTVWKQPDTDELSLSFYKGDTEIVRINTCDFREIQLQFEIEENTKIGALKLHYCYIKAFKGYQI